MKLYHFTSKMHLPGIMQEGLTRGDVPVTPTGGLNHPWLTDDPEPRQQQWAQGCVYNKVQMRITVELPDDPLVYDLRRWPELATELGVDPHWYAALEKVGGGKGEHWYVTRKPVPTSCFTEILDLADERVLVNGEWQLTEKGIEREQMECVFRLGGGELHIADARFPDPWEEVFAYWYEGCPDYDEEDSKDYDYNYRTGLAYYNCPEIEGWELVRSFSTSGETECWRCGPGTDWDGSEEQDQARQEQPCTNTGYRGDPDCKLCEGSGYVYIGDGWAEAVYRQKVDVYSRRLDDRPDGGWFYSLWDKEHPLKRVAYDLGKKEAEELKEKLEAEGHEVAIEPTGEVDA